MTAAERTDELEADNSGTTFLKSSLAEANFSELVADDLELFRVCNELWLETGRLLLLAPMFVSVVHAKTKSIFHCSTTTSGEEVGQRPMGLLGPKA